MYNASIEKITMPPRMARRPVSKQGYPVPWFVGMVNGEWDFRCINPVKIPLAFKRRLCFLCGEPLGQYLCFTIGPMCGINRLASEPPAHRDCAEYAVRACPFLSKPNMRRNENFDYVPVEAAGDPVKHNPGVTLLWITKDYWPISDGRGGVMFEFADPIEVYFWREGRIATRAEILAAIDKGMPLLRSDAEAANALDELQGQIDRCMKLLPAA